MSATVYMADLRHDYGGVLSTDCMPLSVGYMKAVMDRDVPEVTSRLFAYPGRLFAALKEQPPDVVMVGNYLWNEALGLFALRLAKQLNPSVLTVMGGPNIPDAPERRHEYLKHHPEIDVYVCYEGDFLAADVVRQFLDCGKSIPRLKERVLTSCVYHRADGEMVSGPPRPRQQDLDAIPSPWLTGIMDEFFDNKMTPMIETNRGCPFTCSFCVQGTKYYNTIASFSMERLRDEIEYIARRIHERCPDVGTFRIADANYGMYERDITLSGYIAEAQHKYGYPSFIDATTGKNRADRIIRSMEQLNGALTLTQAVQSLDEKVLKNIKRSNIKLDAYESIQSHLKLNGLRTKSDLILGLPGETLQTHVAGLHKMIDAGTDQMHCFQAMMLSGSDLEMQTSRHQFTFETKFRVLPKNYGCYEGQKVFDIEEIVVSTDTLSFADYLQARKVHLTISVFWNDGFLADVVRIGRDYGVKSSEWLEAMCQAMSTARGRIREFMDGYVDETMNELFPTRQACIDFYSQEDQFRRLREGEIGDNLIYKYRAIASYHIWPEICKCAMDTTKSLLLARGAADLIPDFENVWSDLHRYCEARHAHGATKQEVLAPSRAMLHYDIKGWLADPDKSNTAAYRLDHPTEFRFELAPDKRRELDAAFNVWGEQVKGLAKLVTRIRINSQVRDCAPVEATRHAAVG